MTDEELDDHLVRLDDYMDRLVSALERMGGPESEIIQAIAALVPAGTIVAAFVASFIAWRTLKDRQRVDDRNAWWVRTEWALERFRSDQREVNSDGYRMLKILVESDLTDDRDRKLLGAVWPLDQKLDSTLDVATVRRRAGLDPNAPSSNSAPPSTQDAEVDAPEVKRDNEGTEKEDSHGDVQ